MLLVASETGHVYTFATRKLQPMITSEAGKALIQTCLNSPDLPPTSVANHDQRMSATGFEETELSYAIGTDDDQKVRHMLYSGASGGSALGGAGGNNNLIGIANSNGSSMPPLHLSSNGDGGG